jgi:hypothetical protein
MAFWYMAGIDQVHIHFHGFPVNLILHSHSLEKPLPAIPLVVQKGVYETAPTTPMHIFLYHLSCSESQIGLSKPDRKFFQVCHFRATLSNIGLHLS